MKWTALAIALECMGAWLLAGVLLAAAAERALIGLGVLP